MNRSPTLREVEATALTWYHTIDLGGGVITAGEYDTRTALERIPFPADLHGQRCLDVGTHDGFWAFEMERRGAESVTAIDLDDPRAVDFSPPVPELPDQAVAIREARRGAFDFAHRALDSRVERHDLSVYRLADSGLGPFDFAFIGTLLLHLRDPVRALENIRSVLRPGGTLLANEAIDLELSLRHPARPAVSLTLKPGQPFWWLPNAAGVRRYLEKAAFTAVQGSRPYFVPLGAGYAPEPWPRSLRGAVTRAVRGRGMAHAWASGRAPGGAE